MCSLRSRAVSSVLIKGRNVTAGSNKDVSVKQGADTTESSHVYLQQTGTLMFTKDGGSGTCANATTHPHLYPLEARLDSQLLHRPPSVVDVVGAVRLRRHVGEINSAGRGEGNIRKITEYNNASLKKNVGE